MNVKLDAPAMRRLSALLDQALDLDAAQREAWLQQLQGEDAELTPTLRGMLLGQTGDAAAELLERRPDFTAMGALDAPQASAFKADDTVGPYRLLRPLGQGGMGEVWLAERSDGVLKRSVALKLPMLSVRRSVLVQRFERERDILGGLNHPNIARLYDAGLATDGQPYLALEYVEGVPITDYANQQGIDARGRLRLLRQVMDAVQYAHANLIIHRDLKPGNVLVTSEGKALLLDFGIAKLLERESSLAAETELTQIGGRALTLHYAAPEQVNGSPISIATDVWALGVLLYELLTGTRPFGNERRISLEHDLLTLDPVRPSEQKGGVLGGVAKSLVRDLDTIVLKALKKEPGERYGTVSAFADDLDRWLSGSPVLAQPDSTWYRARKFVGRHRLAVAMTGLGMSAVIVAAIAAVMFGLQAREESARASAESARAIAARDFLVDMFRLTDPDLARGKDITARQLLEQGQKTILETLKSQPLLQAELLRGVGEALASMEDDVHADESHAQVERLYLELGRPRDAAIAVLDRAFVAISMGDPARSAELVSRAEKLYPQHLGDDEFMARYLISQGNVAAARGEFPKAREWLAQALPIAQRTFSRSDPRRVYATRVLAETEGLSGDYASAIKRLSSLLEQLQQDRAANPVDVLGILDDLAQFEFQAGRFRVALQRFEAANARCEKIHDPKGGECTFSQLGRSGAMLALGLNQEALQTLPALMAHALTPQVGMINAYALLRSYSILSVNDRLEQHPDIVARVKAMGAPGDAFKIVPRFKVEALLVQAAHLLLQRQARAAQDVLLQARERAQADKVLDPRLMGRLQVYSGVAAQLLGQMDAAATHLDAATRELGQELGPDHSTTLLASVHQARLLAARQQAEAARQLLDHALPLLQEAMGSEAPAYLKLKKLRETLLTSPGLLEGIARKPELFL